MPDEVLTDSFRILCQFLQKHYGQKVNICKFAKRSFRIFLPVVEIKKIMLTLYATIHYYNEYRMKRVRCAAAIRYFIRGVIVYGVFFNAQLGRVDQERRCL